MPMEKHKCKLCAKTFANGRALGGHMKAHLSTFPLPPKAHQLTESASSSSSSSGEEDDEQPQLHEEEEEEEVDEEAEEKGLVYGLRENPKRSFRVADPEFSFAVDAGTVIQDRESETESKNPTRRRSKRNRRPFVAAVTEHQRQKLELRKKPKLTNSTKPGLIESTELAEPEPVSSVSDTSPEEDVAMCLMMLSRDVWMRRANDDHPQPQEADHRQRDHDGKKPVVEVLEVIKLKKVRGKNRCEKCNKLFRSYQAMCGHKKICFRDEEEAMNNNAASDKLFECPFCYKIFGSGQALGGHKRSHLSGSSSSRSMAAVKVEVRESIIDLNLPAPQEEDDFSVLSDA